MRCSIPRLEFQPTGKLSSRPDDYHKLDQAIPLQRDMEGDFTMSGRLFGPSVGYMLQYAHHGHVVTPVVPW